MTVFDRASDGTLTQKPGPAGCISDTGAGQCRDGTGLARPESVTISPDGQSAYVASEISDAVAMFDRAPDGRLAQKPGRAGCISESGGGPCADGAVLESAESVAVSPDGQSAYVASDNQRTRWLVFDRAPNGTLRQKPGTDGCIRDATGAGRCVVGAALFEPSSVALSPDGTSAYVASSLSDAVAVFDREPSPPPPPAR